MNFHPEILKQWASHIHWSVGLLAVTLKILGLPWLTVCLFAVFALKPIFRALGAAAPECSEMIKAWKKTWREILNRE